MLEDPLRAEVVKLHFFVGLTHAETSEVLRLSEKTVRRHWNFARVWPIKPSGKPARRARDFTTVGSGNSVTE